MPITNEEATTAVPLVEVTRGELIESRHRGFIIAVDAAGETVAALGDPLTRTWFRSAAKPFQAVPLITSGAAERFALTEQELAVINGSHSGEAIHLETVRSILAKIGLDEAALQCGAHMPFDETATKRMRAANEKPTALHNNCSGKHAGMLALARHLDQPIETYLDPGNLIQTQIRLVLSRFADVPFGDVAVAVDGCSAPVFGLSLRAMARAYAQLVAARLTDIEAELIDAAERVVAAMTRFPEMVGGTSKRLDTDLMRAANGALVSKVGAEGVQLLCVRPSARYPLGLGIAIKIEDGDIRRARDPVVIEALRQLGVLDEAQLTELSAYARATVFNHRKLVVGEVRTSFKLPT